MRKIEQQMVEAVQSCLDGSDKGWRSGNTEVFVHHHGDRNHWCYQRTVIVRLHGNVIAEFDSALNGARDCRGLTLRDCGYETNTTESLKRSSVGLQGRLQDLSEAGPVVLPGRHRMARC